MEPPSLGDGVEAHLGRYRRGATFSVRTMAPVIRECPHLRRGTWCSLITTGCAGVEACVYKLTRAPPLNATPLGGVALANGAEEPVATCASQAPPQVHPGGRGLLALIGRRLVT